MSEINEIIHQSTRLRIMSALAAIGAEERMDFSSLGTALGLTDGNLGAHLAKLEEARYLRIEKAFVNRKPRTSVSITARGRAALEDHILALKEIIKTTGIG